jgi:hypothetical protein
VPVDSADRDVYVYQVIPGIPDGYRRESTDRQLSDDACRLDFTVVDTMLPPNAPPEGVVLVDASHDYENIGALNLVQWHGTISATYEMARNRARSDAWFHFVALVRNRMTWVRAQQGTIIVPVRFRVSEPQIYGRQSAAFSFSYRWTLPSNAQDPNSVTQAIANMISYSGLWQPATGGVALFSDSMIQSNVWDPKGVSGLSTGNTTSVIVDLCQTQSQLLGPGQERTIAAPGLPLVPLQDLGIDPPSPEDSYLEYRLEIVWETADETVILKPLPADDPPYAPSDGGGLPATGGYRVPYGPAPTPAVVQYRSMPDVVVRLRGSALRWGYSIPAPTLDSVGGVKAYPQNRQGQSFYRTSEVGGLAPPLVAAEWDLRFVLPDVPQGGSGPPDVPTSQPLAAEPDAPPFTIPELDSGNSGLGGSGPPVPPPPPGFQPPELITGDPTLNGGATGDEGDRPPIYRSLP